MELSQVYKLILKIPRQVPTSHRVDAHRIDCWEGPLSVKIGYVNPFPGLRVTGGLFSSCMDNLGPPYSYTKSQRLLKYEGGLAILRGESDDAVDNNYAGQGRYNRPQQQPQAKGDNCKSQNHYPLTLMGRFNCDPPVHMQKNCMSPGKNSKSSARKLEYLNN